VTVTAAVVRAGEASPVDAPDLERVLLHVAALPWPDARGPELAALAHTIGRKRLVEALDRPGAARLGAARLLLS
jgi:hypothetical protein